MVKRFITSAHEDMTQLKLRVQILMQHKAKVLFSHIDLQVLK